jgi:hypothetical protein
VYRNNVVLSLTSALSASFPLLRKLLGGETFERLAALYVRQHPPTSPLMMFYGETLPSFLQGFAPLEHIKYLSDCAALDLAMRHSYHAADAEPADTSGLQDPTAAMEIRFARAPATRVVRSVWPLFDIWAFNVQSGAPKPRAVAQDVLVTRVDFDPQPYAMPTGMADWLDHLEQGQTLGEATEQTLSLHPDFDLAGSLILALTSQALMNYPTKETQ